MLKASVVGNVGGDPDMRYSPDGRPFLRFNVASNGRTKNQQGEWVDETTWVRVTVFGQRAETLSQYLRKGSKVYADGRLEARPWTDQQGQVRAGLEVIADTVEFMSPRGDDGGSRQPVAAGTAASRAPVPDDPGELEDLPF